MHIQKEGDKTATSHLNDMGDLKSDKGIVY